MTTAIFLMVSVVIGLCYSRLCKINASNKFGSIFFKGLLILISFITIYCILVMSRCDMKSIIITIGFGVLIYLSVFIIVLASDRLYKSLMLLYLFFFCVPSSFWLMEEYSKVWFRTYCQGDGIIHDLYKNLSIYEAYQICINNQAGWKEYIFCVVSFFFLAATAVIVAYLFKHVKISEKDILNNIAVLYTWIFILCCFSLCIWRWKHKIYLCYISILALYGIFVVIAILFKKANIKFLIKSSVIIAASTCFFLVYERDLFGYDSYLPKENDISSISIGLNIDGIVKEGRLVNLKERVCIEEAYRLAEAGIERNRKVKEQLRSEGFFGEPSLEEKYLSWIRIRFLKKDGKSIERKYYVSLYDEWDSVEKIYNNLSYKKSKYPIFTMSHNDIKEIIYYHNGEALIMSDHSMLNQYKKDFEKLTLNDMAKKVPIGTLEIEDGNGKRVSYPLYDWFKCSEKILELQKSNSTKYNKNCITKVVVEDWYETGADGSFWANGYYNFMVSGFTSNCFEWENEEGIERIAAACIEDRLSSIIKLILIDNFSKVTFYRADGESFCGYVMLDAMPDILRNSMNIDDKRYRQNILNWNH